MTQRLKPLSTRWVHVQYDRDGAILNEISYEFEPDAVRTIRVEVVDLAVGVTTAGAVTERTYTRQAKPPPGMGWVLQHITKGGDGVWMRMRISDLDGKPLRRLPVT